MSSSTQTKIFTLPSPSSSNTSTTPQPTLLDQIESSLLGTSSPQYPGDRPEDKQWGYKRSVPTLVLYDQEGLRLYDKITSSAPEYYPFPDELHLLKEHGKEIAESMGFPSSSLSTKKHRKEHRDEMDNNDEVPDRPWKPAKWGDAALGKYNEGVNGEEGLDGDEAFRMEQTAEQEQGWDVVELGAGALRKTAHLLLALSSSLSSNEGTPAPIRYHPLDLSEPELHRVLGEMQDGFGDQLKGKVECIGLHGDYNAGLEFIRQGKLASLSSRDSEGLGLDKVSPEVGRESKVDTPPFEVAAEAQPIAIASNKEEETIEPSPLLSPESINIITPKSEISCLPSEITESTPSCNTNNDESGTWSPISSEYDHNQSYNDAQGDSTNPQEVKESFLHSTSTSSTTPDRPLHLVFLGSSLGNFDRDSAIPFLKSLPLRKGDTLLLGLDGRPTPGEEGRRKVEVAYNDPAGHTKRFEEHGWEVVKSELGLGEGNEVEFVGRYNEVLGRHEAYFRSNDKQSIHLPKSNQDVELDKGELLNIEWSYKYSLSEALSLFAQANLRVVNTWKAPNSEYRLWVLERPEFLFSSDLYNTTMALDVLDTKKEGSGPVERARGVPKWDDWLELWRFWDHITLQMIPKEMLHQKPIDLRHICLFYTGHIPTFLDIHLTRLTKGSHTEPEYFKTIFERGIDPDVDDPTKCHDHSEVPMSEEDWPSLTEILAFRDRVRLRLKGIYDSLSSGEKSFTRHTGRVLFMTYEHEAMHAETLLYMLAQSPLTRSPTAVSSPQWDILAREWNVPQENKVITIGGGQIELGHRDLEIEDKKYGDIDGWESHEFGWDNEHPNIARSVKKFKIDSLTISNSDYLTYLKSTDKYSNLNSDIAPASWIEVNGEWKVRSLYGPLSFDIAGRWPLMASKLEFEEYAKFKNGRLPTEEELRMFYEHPDGPRTMGEGANTGVKNWHPTPPTNTTMDNAGKIMHGHNGGVWEWTDTPFKGLEGFVPSVIYPGYSMDFFDDKHFVVLGGSFATIPSIAGRKSFRNWYQANYRFSFIGARVAYDA
ncbi:hypothetical protein I302_100281 [Kwoniella bestiolae CBS 10118]|uniref:Sulfatase-modifying factor enzyme domain-containing protein n=1 Tax=Kwoniella bestiolae CBS 10118 TaxID=1296100 RepID=A0A1B9G4N4_9TREE|nr:hypothetical protein I302_03653 [Kwoniella bestiolae CBS 10118]OCF25976.1 hypothetical protein I302_03653 [Kwoniella bestiolae CBS 10118]